MAEQELKLDSKDRVAFDLMVRIAYGDPKVDQPDPRTYYLTLYRQCYLATHGYPLESILKGA